MVEEAKEMYRFGIATTDGIVVNQHFGRAEKFYVYEVEEGKYKKVECREVPPVCQGGEHDDTQMLKTIKSLSDLDCLIVSRVGIRAQQMLEQNGLSVYEMPGMIEESIQKVYGYIEVQKLLSFAV